MPREKSPKCFVLWVARSTWRVSRPTSRVAYLSVGGGGGGEAVVVVEAVVMIMPVLVAKVVPGSVIYGIMTAYPFTICHVLVGDGGNGGVGVGTVASPYSASYSTDGSGGAASVLYTFVANGGKEVYDRSGPPGRDDGSGGAVASSVSGGGGGHGGGGGGGNGGDGGVNDSGGGSSSGTTRRASYLSPPIGNSGPASASVANDPTPVQ